MGERFGVVRSGSPLDRLPGRVPGRRRPPHAAASSSPVLTTAPTVRAAGGGRHVTVTRSEVIGHMRELRNCQGCAGLRSPLVGTGTGAAAPTPLVSVPFHHEGGPVTLPYDPADPPIDPPEG